jgi:hypothetical protein
VRGGLSGTPYQKASTRTENTSMRQDSSSLCSLGIYHIFVYISAILYESSKPPHACSQKQTNEESQRTESQVPILGAATRSNNKHNSTRLQLIYSCMPHLLLHSALPMMAPVPTAGILPPVSCVFIPEMPKAALMISCGMVQSAGRILSVPVSSLLSALMRSAGWQSNRSSANVIDKPQVPSQSRGVE